VTAEKTGGEEAPPVPRFKWVVHPDCPRNLIYFINPDFIVTQPPLPLEGTDDDNDR
jgi:hypothetical protein